MLTLTRRMFRDFRRLGRWEQSEDVCQNASLRLWKSLKSANPLTVHAFYSLAALQIRRELIDLVRSRYGAGGDRRQPCLEPGRRSVGKHTAGRQ